MTRWRDKSWLGDLRRRYGFTEQPSKYIFGFLFGIVVFIPIVALELILAVVFGATIPPVWFSALLVLFGALLMGFAE